MPNPFPGVDPFIEANGRWAGFHNAMVTYCSELLNASLPTNYFALMEERIELVDSPVDRQGTQPDVGISRNPYSAGVSRGGGVATAWQVNPVPLELPEYEEQSESYIDIRSMPDQELITSIEFLSPTNKVSPGRGKYASKRADTIRQDVNLVEIDLLLDGRRPDVVGRMPPGHFFVFVSRRQQRPRCDVYAWSIRDRLPSVPIPLRSPDADVMLDLATLFSMPYERNHYDQTLRYDKPLSSMLSDDDRSWVVERVVAARKAGNR